MNSVAVNGSLIKMVFQLGSPLATCLIPHMDICTVCPHNPTPTKPAILSPIPPPPPTHTCTACCPLPHTHLHCLLPRRGSIVHADGGEGGLLGVR